MKELTGEGLLNLNNSHQKWDPEMPFCRDRIRAFLEIPLKFEEDSYQLPESKEEKTASRVEGM